MDSHNIIDRLGDFAAKPSASAPATGVTIAWLGGVSINSIISVLTLVYIVLQIAFLVVKNCPPIRNWIQRHLGIKIAGSSGDDD